MISNRPSIVPPSIAVVVRAAALLFVLGITTACFTFRPLQSGEEAPVPGARIRAELTRDGTRHVEDRTGRAPQHVDGILVAESADSLWMDHVVIGQLTASGATVRDTLSVPRKEVATMEVRAFSLPRTAALTAALVATAVLAASMLDGDGSDSGDGSYEPPNLVRIPFLRLIH